MDITEGTAWTVAKDGQQVRLTVEDLQQLFILLASSGDLIVSDEASGRSGSNSGEIGVSLNDDIIEISLRRAEHREV